MAIWLPTHGFNGRVLEMDAKVGGICRIQFTNPLINGQTDEFGGKYLELVPIEAQSSTPTSSTTPTCRDR